MTFLAVFLLLNVVLSGADAAQTLEPVGPAAKITWGSPKVERHTSEVFYFVKVIDWLKTPSSRQVLALLSESLMERRYVLSAESGITDSAGKELELSPADGSIHRFIDGEFADQARYGDFLFRLEYLKSDTGSDSVLAVLYKKTIDFGWSSGLHPSYRILPKENLHNSGARSDFSTEDFALRIQRILVELSFRHFFRSPRAGIDAYNANDSSFAWGEFEDGRIITSLPCAGSL
ncbi:MAG: hypothetical protein PHQ23_07925 [Candidatus Wallbacteria bacterium]|nr:hypothetical protein [Candidatus Wallbacteria bacterium]